MFSSFEDLEVWKKGCALSVRVFEAMRGCRDFIFRDQMSRAALSIPSNIAEGHERSGKDFARFLRIARGSAAELRAQAYIAGRVGLSDRTMMNEIVNETREIARMLFALSNSLEFSTTKRPKKSRNRDGSGPQQPSETSQTKRDRDDALTENSQDIVRS